MTSCGNLSAEEDKLKDLKQQLAELITSENEYTLNNFPQIVEKHLKRLKRFVKKHLDNATEETDFWIEFNKIIDVHFSENDDDESAYFGQMEFWAYPIITDKFGNNTTDTNQWVQIKF